MIVGKESEKPEFKKSTAELGEGVISMAAILNKRGGGELYFGVHNNGTQLHRLLWTRVDKTYCSNIAPLTSCFLIGDMYLELRKQQKLFLR